MKKISLGILLGITLTIATQFAWEYYQKQDVKKYINMFEVVPKHFEMTLPGVKVTDIAISPESEAEVSYVYDELFDAKITYEKNGEIKFLTAPYGISNGTIIAPSKSNIIILDDTADVIYEKQTTKEKP